MSHTETFDLHLDAERVRLYLASWCCTRYGTEVDPDTRTRVYEALERLEAAARKEAA